MNSLRDQLHRSFSSIQRLSDYEPSIFLPYTLPVSHITLVPFQAVSFHASPFSCRCSFILRVQILCASRMGRLLASRLKSRSSKFVTRVSQSTSAEEFQTARLLTLHSQPGFLISPMFRKAIAVKSPPHCRHTLRREPEGLDG